MGGDTDLKNDPKPGTKERYRPGNKPKEDDPEKRVDRISSHLDVEQGRGTGLSTVVLQ
jgi:hypothetical protein